MLMAIFQALLWVVGIIWVLSIIWFFWAFAMDIYRDRHEED